MPTTGLSAEPAQPAAEANPTKYYCYIYGTQPIFIFIGGNSPNVRNHLLKLSPVPQNIFYRAN